MILDIFLVDEKTKEIKTFDIINIDNRIGQYVLNGLSEVPGVEFEDKGCGIVEVNIFDWMAQESVFKNLTPIQK